MDIDGLDRGSRLYLVAHYATLIVLIFGLIAGLEMQYGSLPLWYGIFIAVAIGVGYPMALRAVGIAPERWEA